MSMDGAGQEDISMDPSEMPNIIHMCEGRQTCYIPSHSDGDRNISSLVAVKAYCSLVVTKGKTPCVFVDEAFITYI